MSSTHRVAVIGSGPSGLYTVAALAASGHQLTVDVIDRLPTPYGLVRYGVAPDHAKMKAVTRVLAKPFAKDNVRFLGNVEVGRDITHEELTAHYDAVVYASGTERDRRLDIPGERAEGAVGAGEFVRWYNGHPDAEQANFVLDAEQVAVIGAGNVALDVARVLARTADELRETDVPQTVLEALGRSRVQDIHVLIRRGPAEAKFTPAELFQLSELADATVIVHDGGAGIDDPSTIEDKRVKANLETLRTFSTTAATDRRRHIHLRFLTSPVEILSDHDGHVTGLVVKHNERNTAGQVVGAGSRETLNAQLVVSAVGFCGAPLPGLPFDAASGTIPNSAGRVIDADGIPITGVYVTGWLKRGPSGIIGTNKPCGTETAAAVLADLADLPARERPDVLDLLRVRVDPVDWAGWLRLETHEGTLGATTGRSRVKVHNLAAMLRESLPVEAR